MTPLRRLRPLVPLFLVLAAGCIRFGREAVPAADAAAPAPMDRYADAILAALDRIEAELPDRIALAETLANRHAAGGVIGVIWEPPSSTGPQGPQYEIKGRSGGLMALDVGLGKRHAEADPARDTAIIGWQRAPLTNEIDILRRYKPGYFLVAFGPRALPELAEHAAFCDAWIDTGLPADDRLVELPDGGRAGRAHALLNAANAWVLQAEFAAALTRLGKTPTFLKSHAWADSKEWNGRYRGRTAFHDDLSVPPVPPGLLGRRYLDAIRGLIREFRAGQRPALRRAADRIAAECRDGNKIVVAQTGHTTYESVGRYEDARWAVPETLYVTPGRLKQWPERTADGALVLRLGYSGLEPEVAEVLRAKRQRVILIASDHDTRPDYKPPRWILERIDMGWAFGDACVEIEGYPIRVFPPSGVMQLFAYECLNVEVLARLTD